MTSFDGSVYLICMIIIRARHLEIVRVVKMRNLVLSQFDAPSAATKVVSLSAV